MCWVIIAELMIFPYISNVGAYHCQGVKVTYVVASNQTSGHGLASTISRHTLTSSLESMPLF